MSCKRLQLLCVLLAVVTLQWPACRTESVLINGGRIVSLTVLVLVFKSSSQHRPFLTHFASLFLKIGKKNGFHWILQDRVNHVNQLKRCYDKLGCCGTSRHAREEPSRQCMIRIWFTVLLPKDGGNGVGVRVYNKTVVTQIGRSACQSARLNNFWVHKAQRFLKATVHLKKRHETGFSEFAIYSRHHCTIAICVVFSTMNTMAFSL